MNGRLSAVIVPGERNRASVNQNQSSIRPIRRRRSSRPNIRMNTRRLYETTRAVRETAGVQERGPAGPNTFIVGGAKCGTTSMYSYLHHHPQAFMSPVKEPGFFAPDLPWQPAGRAVLDAVEYAALFAPAHPETHVVRGEASVAYLRSEIAAERIFAAVPEARIIVMLRNPIEVVQSLHEFVRYLGIQPEADLGRALKTAPRAGERWLLDYRSVVDFAPQVERFRATFPREQLHVVVHDDLVSDLDGTWRRVLDFLGLDPDEEVELSRENVTRQARIPALQTRVMAPSRAAVLAARALLPAGVRRRVRRRTLAWNSAAVRRQPLPAQLRQSLAEELEQGVRRLGEIVGRDLSHWLASPR